MTLAVAPAWFADNVAPIAFVILLALTGLVIRFAQQVILRVALLGLIAAVGVFVYVNREPLEACARTCECRINDRDITVPTCNPDVDL